MNKITSFMLGISTICTMLCSSCSESKDSSSPAPIPPTPPKPDKPVSGLYDWESSRTEIPTVNDLVLIYGGGHHRTPYNWTLERIADYVSYTDPKGKTHWLFDGFLFLEIMDPGPTGAGKKFANGYTYQGQQLKAANRLDWQELINYYFTKNNGIDALNQAIKQAATRLGEPSVKRRVIVSIPEPIVYEEPGSNVTKYWGPVDGRQLDFAITKDRFAACQWFIDTVREMFDKRKYEYVELGGFYWLAEKDSDSKSILKSVGDYLDSLKESFNWIPYYNADGYNLWKSYGFHQAYLQPNYFFNEKVPQSRLEAACKMAEKAGMNLELEFDDNALHARGMGYRLQNYMQAFRKNGVWANNRIAYYQGGSSLRSLKYSSDEVDRKLYHEFCEFVVSRPIREAQ